MRRHSFLDYEAVHSINKSQSLFWGTTFAKLSRIMFLRQSCKSYARSRAHTFSLAGNAFVAFVTPWWMVEGTARGKNIVRGDRSKGAEVQQGQDPLSSGLEMSGFGCR
jgi:hypothetical protein